MEIIAIAIIPMLCARRYMKITYHKNKGLILLNPDLQILFGSDRESIRKQLHYDPKKNNGRNDSEDSYEDTFQDVWLRLNFENDTLSEIEVLQGSVYIDNYEVKVGGELEKTIHDLTDKGFVFQKGDYGYTEFNNLFDLGDSEGNGGEENEIAWFYTATNFDHLLEE